MSSPNDSLFGIHAQALELWQRRAQVLAANLANADTPGYLARDINFRRVLAQAGSADATLPLARTGSGVDLGGGSGDSIARAPLEYQVPLQPALDGNTVSTQVEQAAFAQNAIHYQASLTFINAQIQMLRTAINGS